MCVLFFLMKNTLYVLLHKTYKNKNKSTFKLHIHYLNYKFYILFL